MQFSFNQSALLPMSAAAFFLAACLLTTLVFFFITKRWKHSRKKIMGVWGLAWLLSAVLLFAGGAFGRFVEVQAVDTKTYTRRQLTQDLRQLERYITKQNPLFFADRGALDRHFAAAYDRIEDDMTELDFYRLVNPIVVAAGCGHTNLSVSEALEINRADTARFFPLKVTLIGDTLYVMEDDADNNIRTGNEVISINGKTSGEIVRTLSDNISGDSTNQAKPRYIIARHFNSRFYDFVDDSDSFTVVLADRDGAEKEAVLEAEYRSEFNTSAWALHFSDVRNGHLYKSAVYDEYAVLTVHFFMEEADNAFAPFLDDFFAELKNRDIGKLIIDMRGNFGGSPEMSRTLLSHLITGETEYFASGLPLMYNLMGYQKPIAPSDVTYDGNTVILTDGACFSTTGHFCAFAKYHNLATLVGSETGGTYVCTDSSKDTALNHTRLRLHYSTQVYQVAVEGFSPDEGVMPDIYVTPSIDDILNDEDVQMQRALAELGL